MTYNYRKIRFAVFAPPVPPLGRALKKVPNFKLHSLFLNFNSCPRSISSFKSEILFWTGI